MYKETPLHPLKVDGRSFLVKRDDLIDPYLAGNKYRKLYTLLQTPSNRYHTIISYGGTQSNAMLALAAVAKQKGWRFLYYTKPLSKQQRQQTFGNFATALSLGMEHKEIAHELYKDYIATLRLDLDPQTVVVDQGGATPFAAEGLELLAQEIRQQLATYPKIKALATPSGTGTTALFLAKALPEFTLYTAAGIGSREYLKEQMQALSPIPQNLVLLENNYRFAKPNRDLYAIYKKLATAGIEFDLLYAPPLWLALLEQTEEPLLYVHSGGVSGNSTMLARYSAMR